MTQEQAASSKSDGFHTEERARNGEPAGDFGAFITHRRRSWLVKIIQAGFTAVFGLIGLLLLVAGVAGAIRKEWDGFAIFTTMAAGFLLVAYFFTLNVWVSIDFYERGLVWKSPLRRREGAYKDVVRFDYAVVRQYMNAIYVGTSLSIGLHFVDGRKFKWSGRYKETPKGFAFTVFGREFEVTDRADMAKEVIAIHVADRLEEEMRARGEVAWTTLARITPEGVMPTYGRRKRSVVPWGAIARSADAGGYLHLFETEGRKPFVTVRFAGPNYFPGLELATRLSVAATGKRVASEASEAKFTRSTRV